MYNLFNLDAPMEHGIVRFPQWPYAREGLQRNLANVVRFHQRNPTAVQSSHFLVRLLYALAVPQSQPLERYYSNVDAMALNVSMALKMTSALYKGSVFNGIFYGQGNPEILIAHNEDFDYEKAHRLWQHLRPVKVLRHPMSDLGLPILDGGDYGVESGLAVIAINVPLLAVQYRAFRLNEISLTETSEESQRSTMQFIRMYVLPNMLYSHLDLALMNRLSNALHGAPQGKSKYKHSFFMTDYSSNVDEVQQKVIESLARIGKDFAGILRTVPTVTALDLKEALRLPDIAPTRQVVWALSIARLNALALVFRLSKGGAGLRNQSEVNAIVRSALAYKSDSLMKSMLPLEIYFEVEEEIRGIVQKP